MILNNYLQFYFQKLETIILLHKFIIVFILVGKKFFGFKFHIFFKYSGQSQLMTRNSDSPKNSF